MFLQFPDHPLHFLISQGQRTIAVTVLPRSQVRIPPGTKGRKKKHVYHDADGWVSYWGTEPLMGLRFQSENDLHLAAQFLLIVFQEDEIYGYVRLTRTETDSFLQEQSYSTAEYCGSPGIPTGELITCSTGHILLRHPHIEGPGHASLFTDRRSLALEEKAMEGFMKYTDANP